jgi:radical SAM protein with 4Fe4S-binding SPASM domain
MVRSGTRLIIKHFDADQYTAVFNPRTGFFARMEDNDTQEPFWSSHGPELLDISVTNWCDRGCHFCYRKSDVDGTYMLIGDFEEVLRQAASLHVFQIALGGGNPNQHPDFTRMLELARAQYGIVPNYTTNGRGLTQEVLDATAKYCGAVAVSAYAPYDELEEAIDLLHAAGVPVHVHFILNAMSVNTAIDWLKCLPLFLSNAKAIVFLNYKPVGRSPNHELLLKRSDRLEEFFKLATGAHLPIRVGFDTCTITGLARLGDADKISLEGCDAGRFSFFVSERMEAYPCSFMVETGIPGVPLRGTSLLDIWQKHPAFTGFRSAHQKGGCADCVTRGECLSGCPLFPEMNLCETNRGSAHADLVSIL